MRSARETSSIRTISNNVCLLANKVMVSRFIEIFEKLRPQKYIGSRHTDGWTSRQIDKLRSIQKMIPSLDR